MSTDWDAFGRVMDEYAAAFGEQAPLSEMTGDPERDMEILRRAIEIGTPYHAEVPPGAVI